MRPPLSPASVSSFSGALSSPNARKWPILNRFPSSERRNDTMEKLLEMWELKMDAHVRANYPKESGAIRVLPHGNYSISNEVSDAHSRTCAIVLGDARRRSGSAVLLGRFRHHVRLHRHHRLSGCRLSRRPLIRRRCHYHRRRKCPAFHILPARTLQVCSPCLAAATTFGVFTWANLHTNVMMLIAPFLILAIGALNTPPHIISRRARRRR